MPKIKLRHGPTGKVSEFEPVDAREILATPNTEYEPDEDTVMQVGAQYGSGGKTIMAAMAAQLGGAESAGDPNARVVVQNIPQLQGGDEDLQTGLSVEKYGREAVNKAQPGTQSTAATPMSTTARPLSLKDARKGTNPAETGQQPFIEEGGPLDNSGPTMAQRGGSVAMGAGPASYQTAPETGGEMTMGARGGNKGVAQQKGNKGQGQTPEKQAKRAANQALEAEAETKTVEELKSELDAKGVQYAPDASKDQLVDAWVDSNKTS